MLRRAVAIYMAFVLTAGPGLCCCSAASLVAHSLPAASTDLVARPSVPVHSCCCPDRCSTADGLTPKAAEPRASERHKGQEPVKHKCPCQDKKKSQATAEGPPAGGSPVQTAARLLALAFEFVVVCGFDGPHQPPAAGGGTAPPGHRLVARQLLDLHHLLRC